jgi:tol-pal system protein YbgF
MKELRNSLNLLLLCIVITVAGCASTSDVKAVRSELNQQIEEKLTAVDTKISALKKAQDDQSTAVASMRKGQANTTADMSDLRDSVQQLRGQVETLKKDLARDSKKEDDYKEKIDNILLKINFIENFLEIGKKDTPGDASDKNSSTASSKDSGKKQDKETMYSAAYQTFKEGHYSKAKSEFQNYLTAYPASEYSDNAQFWIGECYFFEKNYEKAILEYEKVVKNYAGGNKVPYALLKQGLSFQKLGDKTSAKLLLQQVIKNYPNTNQARIARSKLQELK